MIVNMVMRIFILIFIALSSLMFLIEAAPWRPWRSGSPAEQLNSNDKRFMDNLDSDNKAALKMLDQLYHSSSGWSFITKKLGVTVLRAFIGPGPFVDQEDALKGSKHACIKSYGIIKAPARKIVDLFLNSSRVQEYNEFCAEFRDIMTLPSPSKATLTKISYAISPSYGPFKSRDFCSVVHCEKRPGGTYVIMNRPAYISPCPPTAAHVRGKILLAGNYIEPVDATTSKVTLIAQVNPGGGVDSSAGAWIVNRLSTWGPPGFLQKLERAAQRE